MLFVAKLEGGHVEESVFLQEVTANHCRLLEPPFSRFSVDVGAIPPSRLAQEYDLPGIISIALTALGGRGSLYITLQPESAKYLRDCLSESLKDCCLEWRDA